MIKIGVVIMLAEVKALGRALSFAEIQGLARLANPQGFEKLAEAVQIYRSSFIPEAK